MRSFAWALLVLASGDVLPPLLLAGDSGGRAQYVGGTVAGLPSKSEGNINTTDGEVFLFRSKQTSVRVPYGKINTLEYGQRVNRRSTATRSWLKARPITEIVMIPAYMAGMSKFCWEALIR